MSERNLELDNNKSFESDNNKSLDNRENFANIIATIKVRVRMIADMIKNAMGEEYIVARNDTEYSQQFYLDNEFLKLYYEDLKEHSGIVSLNNLVIRETRLIKYTVNTTLMEDEYKDYILESIKDNYKIAITCQPVAIDVDAKTIRFNFKVEATKKNLNEDSKKNPDKNSASAENSTNNAKETQ